MKALRALPELIRASVRTMLKQDTAEQAEEEQSGKGQGLLKLHEYQHRVIVEVFRISIAGFSAFAFVLSGFSLYMFTDAHLPVWMGLLVSMLGVVLLVALWRTFQEFKAYKHVYEDVTTKLQEKLMQHAPARSQGPKGKAQENQLISTLKPKEYQGWDFKLCTHCHKSIEMLSTQCQHCGHDQDSIFSN